MSNLEQWDEFLDNASVGLHCVDGEGIILWANQTELDFLGYSAEEYLGRSIADFHVDEPVICDMLDRLGADHGLNAYPARVRAKDGSIKHVMINSNVYRRDGNFLHTRCFTTGISKAVWNALRAQTAAEDKDLPEIAVAS